MTATTAPTAITETRRALKTLLALALTLGIAVSIAVFPQRTSVWVASATLRVSAAPSDKTDLESYRQTVLASQLVLKTFAGLVASPATVRRAADSVNVSAKQRAAASVVVSVTPTDTVLTITVKAPTEQTARRLATGLRDGGARYLNDLDNTYDVSASPGVVAAVKVTSLDLARVNELVLFWDVVIMLVVWGYRRRWPNAQT